MTITEKKQTLYVEYIDPGGARRCGELITIELYGVWLRRRYAKRQQYVRQEKLIKSIGEIQEMARIFEAQEMK